MKHLRTYEELNFDFDDEDWNSIKLEKVKEADKLNRFLDYEIEFFIKAGFIHKPMSFSTREHFIDSCKEFTISIQKYKVRDPHMSYYCSINIPNNSSTTINEDIISIEQSERTKLMKNLMRKIYIYLWSKGVDLDEIAEKERKKKELAIKMKDIDPLEEEDWSQ